MASVLSYLRSYRRDDPRFARGVAVDGLAMRLIGLEDRLGLFLSLGLMALVSVVARELGRVEARLVAALDHNGRVRVKRLMLGCASLRARVVEEFGGRAALHARVIDDDVARVMVGVNRPDRELARIARKAARLEADMPSLGQGCGARTALDGVFRLARRQGWREGQRGPLRKGRIETLLDARLADEIWAGAGAVMGAGREA